MQLALGYVVVLLIFGAIDFAWLSTMGPRLYRPVLGDILANDLRLAPAIAFYLLFPIGIVIFAVAPAVKTDSIVTALIYGLLFGGMAYATYDLTNFATLRNWTLQITILDIVYGAVTTAVSAIAAVLVLRQLPQT